MAKVEGKTEGNDEGGEAKGWWWCTPTTSDSPTARLVRSSPSATVLRPAWEATRRNGGRSVVVEAEEVVVEAAGAEVVVEAAEAEVVVEAAGAEVAVEAVEAVAAMGATHCACWGRTCLF